MEMTKWELKDVYDEIEVLYPVFVKWVKKVKGYLSYASKSDIKVVFEFLKFLEQFEVKDKIQNKEEV